MADRSAYWTEYYYANREKRQRQAREFYWRHRDKQLASQAVYRARPGVRFLKKVAKEMNMTYPQARQWLASQGEIV